MAVSKKERVRRLKKWVTALRSGKYKRVTGALHKKGKFCCLGVACDVYRKEVGGKWVKRREMGSELSFKGNHGMLPATVKHWYPVDFYQEQELVRFNDDLGKSFKFIAKYIEDKLIFPLL